MSAALNAAQAPHPEEARELQARLYREIGISAVAAALRFTTQPEPARKESAPDALLPLLRKENLAA